MQRIKQIEKVFCENGAPPAAARPVITEQQRDRARRAGERQRRPDSSAAFPGRGNREQDIYGGKGQDRFHRPLRPFFGRKPDQHDQPRPQNAVIAAEKLGGETAGQRGHGAAFAGLRPVERSRRGGAQKQRKKDILSVRIENPLRVQKVKRDLGRRCEQQEPCEIPPDVRCFPDAFSDEKRHDRKGDPSDRAQP